MRTFVIRGSFRSVGAQIGEAVAEDLSFVLDRTTDFLVENAQIGGDLDRVRQIVERYLSATKADFPEAIAYLEGLAAGGGLALEDVALISFSEEICAEASVPAEKCSTLAVPTPQGWVIGHNEDYEPQYYGKMFALDLRIDGRPRVFSLNYPGHFPCLAGSLNERGVALCNNSLWPDAVPGLSKNVLHLQAAIASDFDKAVTALARQPAALTGHYTLGDGNDDRVCGLEVSNRTVSRTAAHLEDAGREPYWHTNHVRFLDLHRPDPAVVARNHTCVRGERLEELIAAGKLPTGPEEMMKLLSANDGVLHRTPAQNGTSVTLATVVIRPKTGEMWIRDADPSADVRDLHLSFRSSPLN